MKKQIKDIILGGLIGSITTGFISTILYLRKKNELDAKYRVGDLMVYTDEDDGDQIFLELEVPLSELKKKNRCYLRVIHQESISYKDKTVKYAKS